MKLSLKRLALSIVTLLAAIVVVEGLALISVHGKSRVAAFFSEAPAPLAYGLKPGLYAYWHRDRLVKVEIGANGMRDAPSSRPDIPEVWIIGDSQAFGWGLSSGETIASRLQILLAERAVVVNAGVPGYGPFSYLYMAREAPAAALKIVLFTETNDGQDAYSVLPYGRVHCGLLVEPGTLWSRNPCWILESHSLSLLVDLQNWLTPPKLAPALNCNPGARGAGAVTRARLEAISLSLKQIKNVRIGTVPWDARFLPSRLGDYSPVLKSVTCGWEFPDDIGIAQAFIAQRGNLDELFQPADHHLSAAGADLIARRIAEVLQEGLEPDIRKTAR